MKRIIKDKKGITLISLVVTIIVLMILAGITISLVLGPNGIITKAQYAKVQSEIGSEKEQLSMAVTEATLDNNGKQPTLEQIKDKIVEKGIATADNIKIGDNSLQVTTPKGHTYTIDINGDVEYVGEGTVKVPDLTQDNLTFTYTPSSWTNGNVQVGIATTVTGFTLQYSTDGNTWNTYTSAIIASNNETIYARLWDGINYGGVTTGDVTNIDKTNPTLTLSQDANTSTRTITINAIDIGSGIDSIQYNNGTWQALTTSNITNGKSATYQVTANGTYTFRTIDNAGNITSKDIIVTGIIVIQAKTGDFVNYTAGTWTQADINSLGGLYSGTSLPTSGNPYTFGGFGVGSSRDSSITTYSDSYGTYANKYSSGWRVLDLNEDGSIKDIIQAGTPEAYYNDQDSSKSATILTSTRSWSMYVNSTYAISAHCMTYNEAYTITGNTNITDNDLRSTGSIYCIASAGSLWNVHNHGDIYGDCLPFCFGVRPVVTLKSGIQVTGGSGTQANPYQMM